MLSDESSSDSETGRFKQSKPKEEQHSKERGSDFRGRGRPSENDRFRRDFGRQRDERLDYDKHSRDRHRSSRNSPFSRRKHSRDRSPRRRSPDKHRERDSRGGARHHRSSSKEKRNTSSRSHKSPEVSTISRKPIESRVRGHKSPESKSTIKLSPEHKPRNRSPELRGNNRPLRDNSSPELQTSSHKSPVSKSRSNKSPESKRDVKEETRKYLESSKRSPKRDEEERVSLSPEFKGKRSEVYRPPPSMLKRKSDSPILVEEHASDHSEEVQVGSYYKMIPTVIRDKSEEESSEIDSSDDERLRAKLLNIEKELQKTKKKKHKKKHKRKSKTSKDTDEATTSVEVTSTTDIDIDRSNKESPMPEVTSTQKSASKESSEEGEISSGDDTQEPEEQFDASDLRHKLKRKPVIPITETCGPALPPHLEKSRQSTSRDTEGPALPPHLTQSKNIGKFIFFQSMVPQPIQDTNTGC